jgi:hypothetical protein
MTLKLRPHLIPKPLFRKSAANLLPPASWDRIRNETLTAAQYRCAVCKGQGRECHEVWLYDDANAVATLVQFRILCGECHQVVHMGRAVKYGNGRAALIHLCKLNGIGPKEGKEIYDRAMGEWYERNQRTWKLDVAKPLLERYPQLALLIESASVSLEKNPPSQHP